MQQQPMQQQYYEQHQQQQQQQYYRPEDNYNQDDYENLEEIERELNNVENAGSGDFGEYEDDEFGESGPNSPYNPNAVSFPNTRKAAAFLPAGATPQQNGVLSPHAAEFWFPECRNCPCCKGYKHGCQCRKGSVDTCQDPNCVDNVFTSQVTSELAKKGAAPQNMPPSQPNRSQYNANIPPGPPSHSNFQPRGIPPNNPTAEVCRFQSAPGGCRFGASCKYKHTIAAGTGATAAAPRGPTQCVFFMRGNCTYGAACRNLHG